MKASLALFSLQLTLGLALVTPKLEAAALESNAIERRAAQGTTTSTETNTLAEPEFFLDPPGSGSNTLSTDVSSLDPLATDPLATDPLATDPLALGQTVTVPPAAIQKCKDDLRKQYRRVSSLLWMTVLDSFQCLDADGDSGNQTHQLHLQLWRRSLQNQGSIDQ
jgi:hypothetical protein